MVRYRQRLCVLGDHKLEGEAYFVRDPQIVKFIRKRIITFRPQDENCKKCHDRIINIYNSKYERGVKNLRRQMTTVSSISSSLISSNDSYDQLVYRPPRNKSLEDVVNRSAGGSQRITRNQSLNVTSSSAIESAANLRTIQAISNSPIDRPPVESSTPSDNEPSTSAAAAARAAARKQQNLRFYFPPVTAESDPHPDNDYVPSPNALNGTRYPDIQPIPKRHQFVHANKDIMDIYISNTTGG